MDIEYTDLISRKAYTSSKIIENWSYKLFRLDASNNSLELHSLEISKVAREIWNFKERWIICEGLFL